MLDLRRLALICEFARRGSIAGTAASSATARRRSPSSSRPWNARPARPYRQDRTQRRAHRRRPEAGGACGTHPVHGRGGGIGPVGPRGQPAGRVVVTAFPTAAVAFAPALARSLRRHTELTLRLRQSRSGRGMREVQSGEVDIALVDDWYGQARDSENLRVFPLLYDPLVLVVPRKHRAGRPRGAAGPARAARRAVDGHPGRRAVAAGGRPALRRRGRHPAGALGVRRAGHDPLPGRQGHRHRRRPRPGAGGRGARAVVRQFPGNPVAARCRRSRAPPASTARRCR